MSIRSACFPQTLNRRGRAALWRTAKAALRSRPLHEFRSLRYSAKCERYSPETARRAFVGAGPRAALCCAGGGIGGGAGRAHPRRRHQYSRGLLSMHRGPHHRTSGADSRSGSGSRGGCGSRSAAAGLAAQRSLHVCAFYASSSCVRCSRLSVSHCKRPRASSPGRIPVASNFMVPVARGRCSRPRSRYT
jgi:hypothetical protein